MTAAWLRHLIDLLLVLGGSAWVGFRIGLVEGKLRHSQACRLLHRRSDVR